MLAFHCQPELTPDAATYIAENGWDSWQLRFAVDTEDERLLNIIGGDMSMPRTVVLNRRGEVIFNQVGRISPERLSELLEKAESP